MFRYNVLYEGAGSDLYTIPREGSGKWRSFVLFVIGKSGIEARHSLQLDKPMQCQDHNLPQSLPITEPNDVMLIGSGMYLVLLLLSTLLFVAWRFRCSTLGRASTRSCSSPVPSISSQCSSTRVLGPLETNRPLARQAPVTSSLPYFSATETYQSFADVKIYEHISFSRSPVPIYEKPQLSSLV